MRPVEFKEQTAVLAETQPEYMPLPVYKGDHESISCWKFTFRERLKVLFTGRLWLRQLTFGHLLQPQLPEVDYPFVVTKQDKNED